MMMSRVDLVCHPVAIRIGLNFQYIQYIQSKSVAAMESKRRRSGVAAAAGIEPPNIYPSTNITVGFREASNPACQPRLELV